MKIISIQGQNIGPVKNFAIQNMGNVVIIAGANGSGKSFLKDAIKNTFQNSQHPQLSITIESTREQEKEKLGDKVEIHKGSSQHNQKLVEYMNTRIRGGSYTGTVIQIDSNRSVSSVQFQQISLATPDPDDIDLDYRYYLSPFINRWQDIVNKIFQKVANRNNKIAEYAKANPNGMISEALKHNPDPFMPYQELFKKLLPGKTLEGIDPKQLGEFHYKLDNGQVLPFSTLSSGEQEVIKITFDLLWKRITHSIFLIDEPELHLHPTLTFRLIETLKEMGDGTNQFIFFTHSADLISTYYSTGNVYFIDTNTDGHNQAHKLSDLKNEHPDLVELISENIGLFAVGKKLVFIEGEDASIDRLTYHSIAQKYYPHLNFVAVGSVENVMLLEKTTRQLSNSIFGINFYMIRDRDGLSDEQIARLESDSRLRCLKRRHIENYLLDSNILSKVAKRLCLDKKWHTSSNVESALLETAQRSFNEAIDLFVKEYIKINLNIPTPSIKAIQAKKTDELIKGFVQKTESSVREINERFAEKNLNITFEQFKNKLELSLKDGTWKSIFPGKVVFREICKEIKAESDKVRQAYIQIAIEENTDAFNDIKEFFNFFSQT